MNQTDLIIVTIYLICVAFVIYRAWDSLEDQTMIKNVENRFDCEPLKDLIKAEFKFKDDVRYGFSKQPNQLEVTISCQLKTAMVIIDWDRGSLTNFDGGGRRLIRITDGLQKADLIKQTPDTVLPTGKRDFKLTAEGLLEEDPETKVMKPGKPIIDVQKLAEDRTKKPKPGDKKEAEKIQKLKDTYANFYYKREPLKFSLLIPLQITNFVDCNKKDMWGFLECDFTVTRTPRIEYIPWNPKKKK
jgi:hypothetical protein